MKKIILLLTAYVFCFQIAGLSQTRVGLSGGVSIANLKGPVFWYGGSLGPSGGNIDEDGKAGFITAFVLETSIRKSFTFRPTLSYVQKGFTQPPPGLVEKAYVALRYAEFSADFLYYLTGNDGGFYLGGGPSVAFNLPSKRVSITNEVKTTSTIKFGREFGKDLRGVDYGANFTMGWRTKGGLFFNLNYNRGFRNVVPEVNPAIPNNPSPGSLKNSYLGIQLGVFLNNGKSEK